MKVTSQSYHIALRKLWLPQNKLRTQILLKEITKWIFTGCLCVVMTSSQTVMAHNVPRKMGQQLSFFCSCMDKSSNPTCCFFVPRFWLTLMKVFILASCQPFIFSGEEKQCVTANISTTGVVESNSADELILSNISIIRSQF